ncbi:MAG: hypothetical protein VB144_04025 [Clostridia bacterium]|nr:hypothetical protein [Clostridia bacterium]
MVSVPAGNSWGKTGVESKSPVFIVDGSFATRPGLVLVKLDPELTTSYVVALMPTWNYDPWFSRNVWVGASGATDKADGYVNLIDSQGAERYGTDGYLPIKPTHAPAWIGFKVYPGRVEVCVPGMDDPAPMKADWIGEGTPIFLSVFSSAPYESGPTAVAIDEILVGR